MPIEAANNVEIRDEGTTQGRVRILDFTGSGVSASVSGSVATMAISGGAGSDIALSLLAPSTDETITASTSAVVNRSYTIASGKKLTIGSAARFRVL